MVSSDEYFSRVWQACEPSAERLDLVGGADPREVTAVQKDITLRHVDWLFFIDDLTRVSITDDHESNAACGLISKVDHIRCELFRWEGGEVSTLRLGDEVFPCSGRIHRKGFLWDGRDFRSRCFNHDFKLLKKNYITN